MSKRNIDRKKPIMFSRGWLSNFKTRRGIPSFVGHGESGSVDLESCRTQIEEIKQRLATFHPNDVYNCDETGLYLKAQSNKSLDSKPIRGKKDIRAARVSILFCSNATGSDKRKVFVLHKFKSGFLGVIDFTNKF